MIFLTEIWFFFAEIYFWLQTDDKHLQFAMQFQLHNSYIIIL